MLQVQFNAPLRRDAIKETCPVESGLSKTTHEISGVEFAIAVASFQLNGTLVVHHVRVAVHLAVGSADGCCESSGIVGCVALRRHAMGAIFVIARTDGDRHVSA